MKRDDIYYEAMKARDHRFDGKFFVGVKTTGIYCRPICPAKPKRSNVEFFPTYIAAEKAGYRPCLRCRPESAPRSPVWIGTSAVVDRAVKVLHSRETLQFDEDKFAALFGVSARHLRRLFLKELGKTPKQLSFENRLNLARKLITETALPITEIAFAAGFASIRRFNDAFKVRFKKSPREIRRQKIPLDSPLTIALPYRPPFDFEGLLRAYENHRVGDLEWFAEGKMHRVLSYDGKFGQVAIENDPQNSSLIVAIDFPDTSITYAILSRVRNLFDLDSDPLLIANSLESDPAIKKLLSESPGIRLPSGWDPFEIAISVILGQFVSVDRGRTLVRELMEIAGQEATPFSDGRSVRLFPTPGEIVQADLTRLKTTTARKQTLVAFAKAVDEKTISLESTQDVDDFLQRLLAIKGIGAWTANYMALKVLRNTDSFPQSDLILARAVELHSQQAIDAMSPWRGYVAALFWRNYATSLTKRRDQGRKRPVSPRQKR